MEALRRRLIRRERYTPPKPILPWVPACEYQVVITVALLTVIGAYFALLSSVTQYFFGIRNKHAIDDVHSPKGRNARVMDENSTDVGDGININDFQGVIHVKDFTGITDDINNKDLTGVIKVRGQADTDEEATEAPEIPEPETEAPDIPEPETEAPDIPEPETEAPDITEPETEAPDITEPETEAPDITEPETEAPDITEPETEAPDITEPETEAPDITVPESSSDAKLPDVQESTTANKKTDGKPPKNFELRAYEGNLHLVINGIIPVFFTQGVLMFRVWCCYNRKIVKFLHVIILGITLPLACISVSFMSQWSQYTPTPVKGERFWSFHAWMGMTFLLLFVITFVSGIYMFYWKSFRDPYGSADLRRKFVPYHSFLGVAIFIITVAQVVTGLTNYASVFTWDTWEASSVYDYHYYEHDYLRRTFSVKMCLVLYIVSAAAAIYALSRDDFRHRGRIILTKDTEWN